MKLVNDNCMNIFRGIDDESIDLICIDPPYEINYDKWDKDVAWELVRLQLYSLLKNTGNLIIFQGWSNVADLKKKLELIGFELKNWIVWDRIKGRGAKRNFTSTREDILWFTKSNDYTFNKIYSNIPKKTKGMGLKNGQKNRSLSNVWTDISPIVPWSKEKVDHPTQKPIELMERIIKIFSNENDLVFDCFMGSGSTGVACQNLNRDFIGVEREKKYFDIAYKRIN